MIASDLSWIVGPAAGVGEFLVGVRGKPTHTLELGAELMGEKRKYIKHPTDECVKKLCYWSTMGFNIVAQRSEPDLSLYQCG